MGLRQGDPLSSYLFVLGAEVLTRLVKREQGRGRLTGHPLDLGHRYIGHLLYADDCLLVAHASVEEVGVVREVLKEYCVISGQQVNITKSLIIFGSEVHHRHRRSINRILQMSESRCLIQYLGVTIGMKRLPISAFNHILERVRNKLSTWEA